MKALYISLFLIFTSLQMQAQSLSAQEVIKAFQESGCLAQSRCRPPYSLQVVQGQQLMQIQPQVRNTLLTIAQQQAQIWADTILEGDFWADGKTRLQSTKILRHGQKIIGFYITYAERAWYTGDCQFDYNQLSTLQKCLPGYITESTFVSFSSRDYRVDENQFAKFAPAN